VIVLALNCGSSSLKFQADEERVIAQDVVERLARTGASR
jgi:acetate kinase